MNATIRNRSCWTIEHRNWQGKPLFLAACIWRWNPGYIYTTRQYADSAEAALSLLEHDIIYLEA